MTKFPRMVPENSLSFNSSSSGGQKLAVPYRPAFLPCTAWVAVEATQAVESSVTEFVCTLILFTLPIDSKMSGRPTMEMEKATFDLMWAFVKTKTHLFDQQANQLGHPMDDTRRLLYTMSCFRKAQLRDGDGEEAQQEADIQQRLLNQTLLDFFRMMAAIEIVS